MNITFLIGNGFDIGMGLRSKFSHYFSQYVEESKDKDRIFKEFADEIDENRAEWSYFEKKLGEYTEKFTVDTQNKFKAKLRDFEVGFINYLREEEQALSYEQQKILTVFKKALLDFYKNGNLSAGAEEVIKNQYARLNQDNRIYNFVNFNYTEVLKKCLSLFPENVVEKRVVNNRSYVDKIGQLVHIHGYKDKAPLMGVNDVAQIKNKELAQDKRFAKTIVKPLFNQASRTNYDKIASSLISNSNIVCIYGMALGETDKDWWKLILRWLGGESNRQLIVFDYDDKYDESSQFDFLDKEDSIIDKFSEFVKEEKIDVESLRARIHIAVHKNIFALNLRKNESEVEQEVAVTE